MEVAHSWILLQIPYYGEEETEAGKREGLLYSENDSLVCGSPNLGKIKLAPLPLVTWKKFLRCPVLQEACLRNNMPFFSQQNMKTKTPLSKQEKAEAET